MSEPTEPTMRIAKVFDGTDDGTADGTTAGRPNISGRQLLDAVERERVLGYLDAAPVVLAARGYGEDQLDPARGKRVQLTWHTDGDWVFPGAVSYYLSTHNVAPEPEFLAHIRRHGYRPADVDDATRRHAVELITQPTQAKQANPRAEQQSLGARADDAWARGARTLVRKAVDNLGIDPYYVAFDEVRDDAYSLLREHDKWLVFFSERGGRSGLTEFDDPNKAAIYLIGELYTSRKSLRKKPSTDIRPIEGEPPASLFTDRELVEVPIGTEVDRYGDTVGNLVYLAGTPFGQRSLPADWHNRPYHIYRTQELLVVLAGVAIPWFDQPGGGTAFYLPRSIKGLLDDRVLAEIPHPTPAGERARPGQHDPRS